MTDDQRIEAIAALNDKTRRQEHGQTVLTPGITGMNCLEQAAIMSLIARFNAFTPENNPYGERDMGFIYQRRDGVWTEAEPTGKGDLLATVHWRIDYYDEFMSGLSEYPENGEKTHRILTIMLDSEI